MDEIYIRGIEFPLKVKGVTVLDCILINYLAMNSKRKQPNTKLDISKKITFIILNQ